MRRMLKVMIEEMTEDEISVGKGAWVVRNNGKGE